jgi:hypothetical protein
MSFRFGWSGWAEAGVVAALAGAACGNKTDLPPVSGDCKTCTTSATTTGGTTTGSTTTGGMNRDGAPDVSEGGRDGPTNGDAGSVTVTFNVGSTNDTTFLAVSPYDSVVRVSAVAPTGDIVTTGDVLNGEGSLAGVAAGPNWFAVQDPGGATKILPTLQPVTVNSVSPAAALVVIPTSQLTPLTIDQQPWAPLRRTATLIAIFNRGGRPINAIAIGPSLPAGASVAYEQNGAYVTPMNNPDLTTDIEGTAIVYNIANAPTYPATSTIKLGYRLGTTVLSFEAEVSADFVTWMTVAVP